VWGKTNAGENGKKARIAVALGKRGPPFSGGGKGPGRLSLRQKVRAQNSKGDIAKASPCKKEGRGRITRARGIRARPNDGAGREIRVTFRRKKGKRSGNRLALPPRNDNSLVPRLVRKGN